MLCTQVRWVIPGLFLLTVSYLLIFSTRIHWCSSLCLLQGQFHKFFDQFLCKQKQLIINGPFWIWIQIGANLIIKWLDLLVLQNMSSVCLWNKFSLKLPRSLLDLWSPPTNKELTSQLLVSLSSELIGLPTSMPPKQRPINRAQTRSRSTNQTQDFTGCGKGQHEASMLSGVPTYIIESVSKIESLIIKFIIYLWHSYCYDTTVIRHGNTGPKKKKSFESHLRSLIFHVIIK